MNYNAENTGLKLIDKVRIELEQNNHLTKEIREEIIILIGKMLDFGFPLDENSLQRLNQLAVYEKAKYRKKDKVFIVERTNVFVAVDKAFQKYGNAVAGGMLISYLFPNNDERTEPLYQNMMIGVLNLIYGGKSMTDQFRVNELLSSFEGRTSDKGLSNYSLFQSFCQGNMSTILDKIKQKMLNNGVTPQEADSKISELLNILDYNNQGELPNFLATIQRKIAQIYFLTKPLEEDIPSFTSKLILSSIYYEQPEEIKKHIYLDDFGVEYNKMVEEYLEQKKLKNVK